MEEVSPNSVLVVISINSSNNSYTITILPEQEDHHKKRKNLQESMSIYIHKDTTIYLHIEKIHDG